MRATPLQDIQAMAHRWVRERTRGLTDPPFRLDRDGFLSEPSLGDARWARPDDIAATAGGWVLLGEPGAGKTTAFTHLANPYEAPIDPEHGQEGVFWISGAELDSRAAADALIGVPLRSRHGGEPGSSGRLRIILDQLDESAFLESLPNWLRRATRDLDMRGVTVWVACRTSHYPDQMTTVLNEILGSCRVGDLAPLTRVQARDLVTAHGIDAEAFLAAVDAHGVGAFAAIPLTLTVLQSAWQAGDHDLPANSEALFDMGVRRLVTEARPSRWPSWTRTTPEQRAAVAARIAARLVLSGRASVHEAVDQDLADAALPVGHIVGDQEISEGGGFTVSPQVVEETLRTALFRHAADGTVGFAHSSFRAFLAARYLAARVGDEVPMPRRQLESLFLVAAPDEPTAAIAEPLRETAAWLVALQPARTEWLARTDPEGLVGYTTIITDHAIRHVLVIELLERADRLELSDQGWRHERWFLAHPELRSQLEPVLQATTASPTDRWFSDARALGRVSKF